MAASLQVTCQPSASNHFTVQASGSGFSGYLGLSIWLGLSAGVPATLAGLTSARQEQLIYASNAQISRSPSGIAFSDLYDIAAIGAVGNTVYAGVWDDSAVGGTAPLATAGPFSVTR